VPSLAIKQTNKKRREGGRTNRSFQIERKRKRERERIMPPPDFPPPTGETKEGKPARGRKEIKEKE